MSFSHGSKAVFKITAPGGGLTDVSAYLDTTGLDQSSDTPEVTTFGNTAKNYIPGLKDGKFSLAGPFDPAIDLILSGALGGTAGPFEYYPAGTASGLPKYSGSAFCSAYNPSSSVNDANKLTADYQVTGGATRGTAT